MDNITDGAERAMFRRMKMSGYEEMLFVLSKNEPVEPVVPPMRKFPNESARLWHQFVHVKEYNGFLERSEHSGTTILPEFNFCAPCPHSKCNLKFFDFIDAKIHYLLAHQCCVLTCCGRRFHDYRAVLDHFECTFKCQNDDDNAERHYLNVMYVCNCCSKSWPTRTEHANHLHGREHMCPDPVCRRVFAENEHAITHFFDVHYGQLRCEVCLRLFNSAKRMRRHFEADDCIVDSKTTFPPVVPCSCGHQFVYCFHQRDFLLRTLPSFREAIESIAREAPYNRMPDDVIEIYATMIKVIGEVNERLLEEKYISYQRVDAFEHDDLSARQVADLLLGVVDYFSTLL
ncbi:unnamed protein product [Caenorhabditis sp. 36 PRJEB53466]|nr:unnamed protein product [Caenorhabditis sp. 36 PRJEB53466]